jgi:glycosyltransferase involved in cell wall biosynthesis
LNFANQVIFVNNEQSKKIGLQYSRKSNWIPNGAKLPVISKSTEYIQSLGLTEKKYILAVGRITPEKGFDYLIKAYMQLKDTDFRLVIAGDSDHNTTFSKKMIKQAQDNNVILTGFITGEPLFQLYTHAQLFVLPSFHESLSLSLLEAMSYNLDVLVSDIPANLEIKLPENCYFTCGDWNNLTVKLSEKLITNEIPKYDLSPYDWNNIALQTMDVYNKLKIHKLKIQKS